MWLYVHQSMYLPCIPEHHFRLISSATTIFLIICIYNFCNTDRPLLRTWQKFGPEIYALLQTVVKISCRYLQLTSEGRNPPIIKLFGIIRENATWRNVLADTVTDHVR